MVLRVLIWVLWMVALAVLAGSFRLPKVLDIYVGDHHFVVSKRSIIVFVLVVVVAPLLAVTLGICGQGTGSGRLLAATVFPGHLRPLQFETRLRYDSDWRPRLCFDLFR